jgi:hypothetical protein
MGSVSRWAQVFFTFTQSLLRLEDMHSIRGSLHANRSHRGKQVERGQHDLGRSALQLVLEDREVGGDVRRRDNDFTVDGCGACVDVPGVRRDFFKAVRPVVAPPREYLDGCVSEMDLNPVPSNLTSCIHLSPLGTLSTEVASSGSMKPGNGAAGFLRWNAT